MNGTTQAEIVWRLRSVYDQAEAIEVLRHLYEEGFVQRRVGTDRGIPESGLVTANSEEEYWFVGDRQWYQASWE